jgi:hypothetical protein
MAWTVTVTKAASATSAGTAFATTPPHTATATATATATGTVVTNELPTLSSCCARYASIMCSPINFPCPVGECVAFHR